MITKGVSQEEKPSVLFALGDLDTTFTSSSEVIVYQRTLDFTKIDYLFHSSRGHMDGTGSGTSYIKYYIGGVLKATHTIPDTNNSTNYGRIDCTAITGRQAVKITCAGATDNLLVDGIYLGVVDA